MAEVLFYVLAAGALAFGVGVIAARMPLFSVLSLLGTFFCLAGIYLLAGFQFLAVTQLLVYAGAIMVLFLFVIMLLNQGDEEELTRVTGVALSGNRLAVAALTAGTLGIVGIGVAGFGHARTARAAIPEGGFDDLEPLAEMLFSRYMLPFEAASLLLLATMIAVVALAKRQREKPEAKDSAEGTERLGWPWSREVS